MTNKLLSVFEAYARLIAAAPDLLAALEEIADICDGPAASRAELAQAVKDSARAAIVKARGED